MESPSRRREALASALHHRLGLLLALQCLAIFAVGPLISDNPFLQPVGGTIFGLMFMAGMTLIAESGRLRRLLIVTGVMILSMEGWRYAAPSPTIVLIYPLLLILFLLVLSVALATILARQQQVTTDVILGAVALYLNIGLIFAASYAFLDRLDPQALGLPSPVPERPLHPTYFVYFSLVTLTTVGYGDTVPISPMARSLATLEAAIGQLYPAIILARLVSLHTSSR